jgi:hypothetical protein
MQGDNMIDASVKRFYCRGKLPGAFLNLYKQYKNRPEGFYTMQTGDGKTILILSLANSTGINNDYYFSLDINDWENL